MQSTSYHEPVLLNESVDHLISDVNGTYLDGTLGGGGHTTAILGYLTVKGAVYGIDQDDEALETASSRINDNRFTAVKGNFGYMDVLLPPDLRGNLAGILLDLGVSSHQIDDASRGFTFREDSRLDMRMNSSTQLSAYEVVNTYDESELTRILFEYGEERFSRKIVDGIIKRRPVNTTGDLKGVVEAVVKGPHVLKSVARVFQAIRIEVNQELEMLKQALKKSVKMLKPGGKLVAISYHSLEDRLVKHFIRKGNFDNNIEKDFFGNEIRPFDAVKPGLITPADEEIARNPRARSARMRVAVRNEVIL